MPLDRIKETYRRHTVLAARHEGQLKGRVFKDRQVVHECEGTSIDEILVMLKEFIDVSLYEAAENRQSPPDGEEYVRAFKKIQTGLTNAQCAMLKAHYRADGQTLTATELAKAAGYATYSAANLQYGMVGYNLNEELPIKLETRANGTPIATFALATAGEQKGSELHWSWKLRPEVAYAIEKLGLHT